MTHADIDAEVAGAGPRRRKARATALRRTVAALVVIGSSVVVLAACSSESDDEEYATRVTQGSVSAVGPVAPSVTAQTSPSAAPTTASADGLPPPPAQSQVVAFTARYQSQFPDLAAGRRDSQIESVFKNSCLDIRQGKDEATVTKNLALRIEHGDVTATPDQASAVYQLVRQFCTP